MAKISMAKISVVIIIILLSICAYAFIHDDSSLEQDGNDVVAMIEQFKKGNGHYPEKLNELGTQFDGELNKYKGHVFVYWQTNDGCYLLCMTDGADYILIYHPLLGYWSKSYDTDIIAKKKEKLFDSIYGHIDGVTEYDSIGSNVRKINTIYSSIPDSTAYCRSYYKNGKIAAEGWIVFFDDRESDFSSEIGTWKYYTEDGIVIEKNWD